MLFRSAKIKVSIPRPELYDHAEALKAAVLSTGDDRLRGILRSKYMQMKVPRVYIANGDRCTDAAFFDRGVWKTFWSANNQLKRDVGTYFKLGLTYSMTPVRICGGGGGQIAFTKTKAEIDALIAGDDLVAGALYEITGVHPTLYDDGTTSGTTVYLRAISGSELDVQGMGKFYNPKYNQAVAPIVTGKQIGRAHV